MHILNTILLLLSTISHAAAQKATNDRSDRPPRGTFGIHTTNTNNSLTSSLSTGLSPGLSQKGGRIQSAALLATGGSGCRANSVASNFNDDGSIFTLLFNDFAAAIGPGVARDQHRRFCGVSVKLKVPVGWTVTIRHVDWRGYVDLDRGVGGSFGSHLFWSEKGEDRVSQYLFPFHLFHIFFILDANEIFR
jgi:hypothetical protein